ncbi:hypothetical protein Scep_027150 [Stephania cephalantha]|uniref:Peptidase A1 domain-containing protein n=1 Tax=Stephania cephalantha TaxID=152367 RepID=A0AAP0ELV4_9MAGN
MAYNNVIILALFASILTTLLSISSIAHGARSAKNGFSVDFVHRDSPHSPFYNPSETDYDRLKRSIIRSTSRLNSLSKTSSSVSKNTIEAEVTPVSGEFLMKLKIGTPPVDFLGIADTGSDLVWIQCEPCDDCYKQVPPLFDSQKSSSYKELSCGSSPCIALGSQAYCNATQDTCQYSYSYGDSSNTQGDLASETLTFDSTSGSPVVLKNVTFGCGHSNSGTFSPNGSGLVGLGGGPVSLISQLGDTIAGKFSYCLTPLFTKTPSPSTLNFGSNAVVSGKGVVTTPRIGDEETTFYYLTLEGLTVGSKGNIFRQSASATLGDEAKIIIDSGTTLTYLPNDLLETVVSGVTKAISLRPVQGPEGLVLCYNVGSGEKIDIPSITAHFSGADVVLNPVNTFVRVDESTLCLAFASATGNVPIFGNIAQINFLVGYDLEETVSFKPTNCSKEC